MKELHKLSFGLAFAVVAAISHLYQLLTAPLQIGLSETEKFLDAFSLLIQSVSPLALLINFCLSILFGFLTGWLTAYFYNLFAKRAKA